VLCSFCGRKNRSGSTTCEKCGKPVSSNNDEDRWSEHGLGHLLNPSDPESEDRDWIAQAWLAILHRSLKLSANKSLGFEASPAVGLEHAQQNFYTEYPDPRRDEWSTVVVPALQTISLRKL
jgi:hypothetical protein